MDAAIDQVVEIAIVEQLDKLYGRLKSGKSVPKRTEQVVGVVDEGLDEAQLRDGGAEAGAHDRVGLRAMPVVCA